MSDDAECESSSSGGQTVIGMLLGLAGSICINTGNNYQSLGMHILEEAAIEKLIAAGVSEIPLHPDIKPSDSPTWIFGTVVFICGSALNFTSFPFASTSVLAPLEAIQFVSNVLWGKFLFGKVITDKMWIGTVVTIFGVMFVLGMGPKEKPECEKPKQLIDFVYLWRSPLWLGYLVFCFAFGTTLLVLYKRLNAKDELAKKNEEPRVSQVVLGVLYAVLSGIIGSHMMIAIKVVSGITFSGEPVFTSGQWWGFWIGELVAFVVFMVPWLVRLNESLLLFDPIMIVPLVQSNFIVWAIIGGGIYFQDFTNMEFSTRGSENWIGFFMGICIIFTGIYLLSPSDYAEDGDEVLDEAERSSLSENVLRASFSPVEDQMQYVPEDQELPPSNDVEVGASAGGVGLTMKESGLRGRELFKAAAQKVGRQATLAKHLQVEAEKTRLEKINKVRHDTSAIATRVLMPSIARVNHHNLKVGRAVTIARTYSEAQLPGVGVDHSINRASSSRSLQARPISEPVTLSKAKLGRSFSEGRVPSGKPPESDAAIRALRTDSDGVEPLTPPPALNPDEVGVEPDQISIEMTSTSPTTPGSTKGTTTGAGGEARATAASSDLGASSEDAGEMDALVNGDRTDGSNISSSTELSARDTNTTVNL